MSNSDGKSHCMLTTKPERVVDYKIVLLGETSVGKSSILERLQHDTFNDSKSSTIGAAFISKKVIKNETDLINLQIWDTAGQERFHNLTPLYYRNSNAAIIVFDLTNLESFKKAEYWIGELNEYIEADGGDMKIILVGNKLDLLENGECRYEEEIRSFLENHKEIAQFFRASAKNNIMIREIFEYITDGIDASMFNKFLEDSHNKGDLIDLNFNVGTSAASSCQC